MSLLPYQALVSTIYEKIQKKKKLNIKSKLPDESQSVSGIQDYFEYMINMREKLTDNPPIQRDANQI